MCVTDRNDAFRTILRAIGVYVNTKSQTGDIRKKNDDCLVFCLLFQQQETRKYDSYTYIYMYKMRDRLNGRKTKLIKPNIIGK